MGNVPGITLTVLRTPLLLLLCLLWHWVLLWPSYQDLWLYLSHQGNIPTSRSLTSHLHCLFCHINYKVTFPSSRDWNMNTFGGAISQPTTVFKLWGRWVCVCVRVRARSFFWIFPQNSFSQNSSSKGSVTHNSLITHSHNLITRPCLLSGIIKSQRDWLV